MVVNRKTKLLEKNEIYRHIMYELLMNFELRRFIAFGFGFYIEAEDDFDYVQLTLIGIIYLIFDIYFSERLHAFRKYVIYKAMKIAEYQHEDENNDDTKKKRKK